MDLKETINTGVSEQISKLSTERESLQALLRDTDNPMKKYVLSVKLKAVTDLHTEFSNIVATGKAPTAWAPTQAPASPYPDTGE